MNDAQKDINYEILSHLKNLDDKITTMVTEQAVREERYDVFAESFKQRTKNIEELMGVLNQGKTAAKLVAVFIAFLAALGAGWDWVVAHIRIL